MKTYALPDWINDFVEKQYLKGFDKCTPEMQKQMLYCLGRLPLHEARAVFEATIPEQDAEGRYLKGDTPKNLSPDELLVHHIWVASGVQEILSGVLQRQPKRPFSFVPVWSPLQIEQRIRSRDWAFPWGAGSKMGQDIFILQMNVEMGLQQYRPAFEAAMAVCHAFQNSSDGMWGEPGVSEPYVRVNGTMKVLSRVHMVQECHLPFADKIINYVIDFTHNGLDAVAPRLSTIELCCTLIDIVFCFKYAVRITGHRRDDVNEALYSLFPRLDEVRKREDASIGLIYGTVRRIALILGLKEQLGWPDHSSRFPAAKART